MAVATTLPVNWTGPSRYRGPLGSAALPVLSAAGRRTVAVWTSSAAVVEGRALPTVVVASWQSSEV